MVDWRLDLPGSGQPSKAHCSVSNYRIFETVRHTFLPSKYHTKFSCIIWSEWVWIWAPKQLRFLHPKGGIMVVITWLTIGGAQTKLHCCMHKLYSSIQWVLKINLFSVSAGNRCGFHVPQVSHGTWGNMWNSLVTGQPKEFGQTLTENDNWLKKARGTVKEVQD